MSERCVPDISERHRSDIHVGDDFDVYIGSEFDTYIRNRSHRFLSECYANDIYSEFNNNFLQSGFTPKMTKRRHKTVHYHNNSIEAYELRKSIVINRRRSNAICLGIVDLSVPMLHIDYEIEEKYKK